MAWIWLVGAGLLEVGFALFLKLSEGFSKWPYTLAFVICAALSFYCLTRAMAVIPIGTAYAIWTGIGAVGVVILGIVVMGEPASALRILFITTLIGSIIGLKLVSA